MRQSGRSIPNRSTRSRPAPAGRFLQPFCGRSTIRKPTRSSWRSTCQPRFRPSGRFICQGKGRTIRRPLFDQRTEPWPPPDGQLTVTLPPTLVGANISGLRLVWRDEAGARQAAILPVHIKDMDDLLPPEEFKSLTAQDILDCLLSGQEPAEWVDALERKKESNPDNAAARDFDSLRAVDTSSYLLYRTRRLGIALTALGERLFKTVRSSNAMAYRLRQDPLGPRALAETLVREWREGVRNDLEHGAINVMFSLAEINLTLAHVARRVAEEPLRSIFSEVIGEIDAMCREIVASHAPPPNLARYLHQVGRKQVELLEGGGLKGQSHA